MRVLIYGAGVIGSLYAVLLADAGIETAVYARGKRLESLQKYGLQYKKGNRIRTVRVPILAELKPSDWYDYILLAVREHQLLTALDELRENISPTIVTMVNAAINLCAKAQPSLARFMRLPGLASLFVKIWDPMTKKKFGPKCGFEQNIDAQSPSSLGRG